MQTDTFLLVGFLLILTEYILRLRRSIDRKAEEKFQQMKHDLMLDEKALSDLVKEAEKARVEAETNEPEPSEESS